MKRLILALIFVLSISISGCNLSGGSGGSLSEPVTEGTYSGDTLYMTTDSSGKATVTSSSLGAVYEVSFTSPSDAPVTGVSFTYSESGGRSVIYVTDDADVYADVIMIGTPAELSAEYAVSGQASSKAALYKLAIVMKAKGGLPAGFTHDAEELDNIYISASERTGTGWSTDCYTAETMAEYISANAADKKSAYAFSGLTAGDGLFMLLSSAWSTDSGLESALTEKLAEVYGMTYANAALAVYQMTCFAPDGTMGDMALVCAVVKSNDVCQSSPGTGGDGENNAPTVDGTEAVNIYKNDSYSFTPTVEDADGDTLTFTIANKPDWAVFNQSTGELSGTAEVGVYAGIVITVSDGTASVSLEPFTIVVSNRTPVISGSPAVTAVSGAQYSFTPTAGDADGDILTFSIENKPSWASFNTSTGALTGTATTGIYSNIIISVSDGLESADLTAFSITVESTNNAPNISGTPTTSIYVNSDYSFIPTATDADSDTLTFSVENLPDWASFSTTTGAVTGTATPEGVYSGIVISVSDGEAGVSLASFDITVQNRAPSISGTPTPVKNGKAFIFIPTVSDPDGDTVTVSAENLPAWATFTPATKEISGTAVNGKYENVTLTASDGRTGGVSTLVFDIDIYYPWAVMKTGMTGCWNNTQQSVDCTGTGQDGEYQAGVSPNFTRDDATGIVTDSVNGLVWQDDINVGLTTDTHPNMSDYCTALGTASYGGYSDWRLPTLREFLTTLDYSKSSPLSNSIFQNGGNNIFWTADNYPGTTVSAMVISTELGTINASGKTPNMYAVRCVRSDDAFPAEDFTRDDAYGIVTDDRTGLIWGDSAAMSGDYFPALSDCEASTLGGYDDWRLANIAELNSIVDTGYAPPLNPVFVYMRNGTVLSSTLNKAIGYVAMFDLEVESGYNLDGDTIWDGKFYRCVRGGLW
ncbi:MAG: DUF1566 domain-containing protein [Deferribacterales bacterium]